LGFYNLSGAEAADLGFDLGNASEFTGLARTYVVAAFNSPAGTAANDLAAAGLAPGQHLLDRFRRESDHQRSLGYEHVADCSPQGDEQPVYAGGDTRQRHWQFGRERRREWSCRLVRRSTFHKNIYTDIGAANWYGTFNTRRDRGRRNSSLCSLGARANTRAEPLRVSDLGTFTADRERADLHCQCEPSADQFRASQRGRRSPLEPGNAFRGCLRLSVAQLSWQLNGDKFSGGDRFIVPRIDPGSLLGSVVTNSAGAVTSDTVAVTAATAC